MIRKLNNFHGRRGGASDKSPASAVDTGDRSLILGQQVPLEDSLATPSGFLPGDSHRQSEPGGPQSTGSQGVGHD